MNSIIIFLIIFTLILFSYVGFISNDYISKPNSITISQLNILGLSLALLNENNIVRIIILISAIVIYLISELDIETTILMNTGLIGLLILSVSKELILIYLALELIGLSFYVLAGRERRAIKSTEAGLKYFILGALSSGILLMGIALIYAQTGTTDLELISLGGMGEISNIFIIIGLLFKLGAAPFHMWVPDVYEGSATIITTFFAIVPKIAYLNVLMLINNESETLLIIGIISILIGSLGAINQTKLKRLLAYSAIGHVGFMLLGLGIGTIASIQATLIYMIIYLIMTIQTFTVIISQNINKIVELNGLSRQNTILGITLGLGLMSIAGVPPLAGFYNKYLIILSVIEHNQLLFALIAILVSVISSFYYVRIINFMFFIDTPMLTINQKTNITIQQAIILGITTYLILTLMLFPNVLMEITLPNIY